MIVHATIPGGQARNGRPERKGYTYRGTGQDQMPWLGDEALAPYRVDYQQWIPDLLRGRPVQPCGTPAAYRRHKRRGEDVCEECRQAEARDFQDRTDREALNARRRERYAAAIAAGMTSAEARQEKNRAGSIR